MKLKNILIVVEDIEKSKKFYHDLFQLDVILNQDGNVILTEGLVLQQKVIWKRFLGKEIIEKSNSCELYFEEPNLEGFVEKLDRLYPSVLSPLHSLHSVLLSALLQKPDLHCTYFRSVLPHQVLLS